MLLWMLGFMYLFELLFFFFGYIPRSRITGSCVVLFLVFLRKLFSAVAAPIYILTNSLEGSSFLHILTSVSLTFYFMLKHSWLTMLCQFQVSSRVVQVYNTYVYSFHIIFTVRLLHNIEGSSCTIQQVLAGYPF